MPVANRESILKWLEGQRGQAEYVRLRAGRNKAGLSTLFKRGLGNDTDLGLLADEIVDRHGGITKPDKGWLEGVTKGVKAGSYDVVDTLPLGAAPEVEGEEEEDEESPFDDLLGKLGEGKGGGVGGLMAALVGTSVGALVKTNQQLADENRHLRNLLQDMQQRHTESVAAATSANTLLQWVDEHGMPGQEADGMSEALKILGPNLGPALGKLAEGVVSQMNRPKEPAPPRTAADGTPETPDARADRLLTEVEQLWENNPETLTGNPLRLLRLKVLADKVKAKLEAT